MPFVPMRPKTQKTLTVNANASRNRPLLGVFESLAACAGATGIPAAVLKKAKRAGCPAFVAHRVELVPLLTWLFSNENEAGADWPSKFKEYQARREELKFEREKGELVPVTELRKELAAGVSRWHAERVRVEQEWPVRLAGKDIPECRAILKEFTSAVGGFLDALH